MIDSIKLVLFVLLLISCKETKQQLPPLQNIVNATLLEKDIHNGRMLYKGVLFTGISKQYIKDGTMLKKLVTYKKGLKNGLSKRWYDNGILNYETQYVNGCKQGLTKVWFKSEQLQSEAAYVRGVVHGLETVWYRTGEKQKERNLYYGQEKGMQKAWRKNGKLYANYEAVNGRIFGLLGANMCYKVENEKIKK